MSSRLVAVRMHLICHAAPGSGGPPSAITGLLSATLF